MLHFLVGAKNRAKIIEGKTANSLSQIFCEQLFCAHLEKFFVCTIMLGDGSPQTARQFLERLLRVHPDTGGVYPKMQRNINAYPEMAAATEPNSNPISKKGSI